MKKESLKLQGFQGLATAHLTLELLKSPLLGVDENMASLSRTSLTLGDKVGHGRWGTTSLMVSS